MRPAKEQEPAQMIHSNDMQESRRAVQEQARLERYRDEEARVLAEMQAHPFPRGTSFIALNTGLDLAGALRALRVLAERGLVTGTERHPGQNPTTYIWEAK